MVTHKQVHRPIHIIQLTVRSVTVSWGWWTLTWSSCWEIHKSIPTHPLYFLIKKNFKLFSHKMTVALKMLSMLKNLYVVFLCPTKSCSLLIFCAFWSHMQWPTFRSWLLWKAGSLAASGSCLMNSTNLQTSCWILQMSQHHRLKKTKQKSFHMLHLLSKHFHSTHHSGTCHFYG